MLVLETVEKPGNQILDGFKAYWHCWKPTIPIRIDKIETTLMYK